MTISLLHNFTSPVSNDSNPNTVGSTEWNEEHVITMATGKILGRTSSGTGAVEELNFYDLNNGLFPEDYGAVGDGSTDDTTAFAAALTAAAAANRVVFLKGDSKYRVSSITVPANTAIIGCIGGRDITTDNEDADFTTLGSAILLNSSSTITLGAGAALRGCLVYPYGFTYPQSSSSAWAGTAVTIAGYGAEVTNNWIIGFATGITSTNYSRLLINKNSIDANNGISVTGSYDTTRILNNQLWPFATHKYYISASLGGGANLPKSALFRTGTGINLGAGNDHTVVHGNLMISYLKGMVIAAGSIAMGENWIDHVNTAGRGATNIGITFSENCNSIKIGNLWVWGYNTGVYFDQLSTETVDIEALLLKFIDDDAVVIDSGTMNIDTLDADEIGGNIFSITSTSTRCHVGYARVQNTTGEILETVGSINITSDTFRIEDGWDDYTVGTDPFATSRGTGNEWNCPALTAATELLIPTFGNTFRINGTTTINRITPSYPGRIITLWFAEAPDVNSVATLGTGNVYLAGNVAFTTIAAQTTLQLMFTGYNWNEVSRSINSV